MDDTPASPASSDSDAYNTEDARLYFGPLKTPERNFVAASQGRLFPAPPNPLLRRSPRLSSPRSRSPLSTDVRTTEEDMMDIDQVAQLVKASDEEEGDVMESGSATPQGVHFLPDEPSSALADKIMHALDNPSPPPSPPLLLSMFDPYHTTVADPSNDYQTDLMSLKISQEPEYDETSPSAPSATIAPAFPISPSAAIPPHVNNPVEAQEDLISFNSFSTPPPANTSHLGSTFHQPQLLSVDDLLSQSPANLSGPPIQNDVQDVVVAPLESSPSTSHLLLNQSPVPGLSSETDASTVVVPEIIVFGLPNDDTEQECLSPPMIAEAQPISTETFLRRSTRPRRSVTPSLPLPTAPTVPMAPPSPARTQIKKKLLNSDLVENVASGSRASLLEGRQQSPSDPAPSTTIRVRHRSPGKGPLSFQRELGSLSPTSSNLLSGLGFTASESTNVDLLANQEEVSVCTQPMSSFSTFPPPTDAGLTTPNRSSGPVRISSPVKGISSPNKFRIQTPAPNDPKNTPARRIPIAEAIAQGHISPEKSIQMGFRPNGTPLTSTPTPARRVLVSNLPSHPPPKLNTLRFGKPAKREASGEPRQQAGSLDKGKGKEVQIPSEPSTARTKLPFPLVPSIPAPIEVSASSTVDVTTKARASPVKSRLKQATSRIPRIGVKPYSRSDNAKVGGGHAKDASTARMGGTKLTQAESAPNVRRAALVTGSVSGTAASRTSAIQSGSTTLLKRKREAEKASPVKPRVVMLRQVPQVVITPTDPIPKPLNVLTASATAKNKQTAMRRVMDPEPSTSAAVQPPFQNLSQADPLGIPTAENKPAREPSALKEPLPPKQLDELSSGSPMKQDLSLPTAPELIPEQTSAPTLLTAVPESNNMTLDSSSTSDLRRTTRSRRTAIIQDVFSNPPSRPSARRKSPAFRSDDIFSGMSLTALKDLTVSNTVRNQRYLAAKLETEVVRREGVRPESPAVKVRTMVQKQQEEKDKQRAERANRRARRSGDMGSSDIEGFSDVGYSSPCEDTNMADGAEPPPRHQRGAGEDDDYETPERHHRDKKRTRLFDDVDIMDTSESVEPKRRVKWDRGLFTTVYIDEVKLGSRETLKENRSLKGILAPTAKALRLDTLGNLPHADSPLADLVQENITVKKIVYDSDVPPVSEDTVVKNTRSKNKKK